MINENREIICIDDSRPTQDVLEYFKEWVVKDKIYTIRKVQQNLSGVWGVLLQEIVNDRVPIYMGDTYIGKAEVGYRLTRFRHLDGTEIAITATEEETVKNN